MLFRFTKEQESPLLLTEEQVFTTKDGKERRVALTNRFVGGEFIAKGGRIVGTMSRWSVGALDDELGILLLRIIHARGGQDGLIVLLRHDAPQNELRMTIANRSSEFGVGPEDFASLTWVQNA